jgi:NADH:ubiquinone oxidoreductase subunit B-like Fe-S oxidoreductase
MARHPDFLHVLEQLPTDGSVTPYLDVDVYVSCPPPAQTVRQGLHALLSHVQQVLPFKT